MYEFLVNRYNGEGTLDEAIIREMNIPMPSGRPPSDRELARRLGVSQPTITRHRNRLYSKGLRNIVKPPPNPDVCQFLFEIIPGNNGNPKLTVEDIPGILKKRPEYSCFETVITNSKKVIIIGTFESYRQVVKVVGLIRADGLEPEYDHPDLAHFKRLYGVNL